MVKLLEDPFKLMIETVTELYGEITADVQFAPINKAQDECVGATSFFEDGKPPLISISGFIPFYATIEIFAHELAHVVAGIEDGHGQKWETTFNEIHELYMKKAEENFNNQSEEAQDTTYNSESAPVKEFYWSPADQGM